MLRWKPLAYLALTLVVLGFGGTLALGRPFRVNRLPDQGKNWGCGTCHINPGGGGPRNAFGQDWEKLAIPAGDRYTDQLARKDSDGDGFTNDEEFNADPPTKPWDPKSKPKVKPPQAVTSKGKQRILWAKLKQR